MVLHAPLSVTGNGNCCFRRYTLPRQGGVLVYLDESMETEDDMRQPNRFVDGQADRSLDTIARRILPMRIRRLDVEIGDVARLRDAGLLTAMMKAHLLGEAQYPSGVELASP